jgi:transposase InsO family protein
MPWGAMSTSELRVEFVRLVVGGGVSVAELCRRFGVSGKTGHKWLGRYREQGEAGLADRSRRPGHSPRRSDAAIEEAVLAVRAEHPAWGGRKIARVLERRGLASPSPSTVTAILRRHGVELGRLGGGHAPYQRFERAAPNELWQMDFKGHVGLGSGERLHPLTVLDDHSRFAVVLAACRNQQTETVRSHLVAAFRHYGLPQRIITDNGSPWGDGPGSPYTPLGVFLIEQGIAISHSRLSPPDHGQGRALPSLAEE